VVQIRDINVNIKIGILDLALFTQHNKQLPKRLTEKEGTQFLLKSLLGNVDFNLLYTENGKPYLNSGLPHISISHSHDRLAIITNQAAPTGIDIELVRDKVLRIRHKFLNADEAVVCGDDVARLITVWAAKETLYKVDGLKGLDFREHLAVEFKNNGQIRGVIKREGSVKEYILQPELTDDYALVYVLNEI
jgi:4'-phosphopantetheinyl transferase